MKKTVRKRWISIILAVIMFLALIPTSSLQALAATQAGSFKDVTSEKYYYSAVLWAIENKVTSGTSKTTFSPGNDCTRGQIVTFIYNAVKGRPVSSAMQFSDVKAGAYYYNAVGWAVSKKVTSGTSATTFSPNQSCTRAQAVTFLWNVAGSPVVSSTNYFEDVKPDRYYTKAVAWAVSNKITAGTSDKTFSPNDTCTRAQIVTLLYNYFHNTSHNNGQYTSPSQTPVAPANTENHTVTFLRNDGSDGAYLTTTVKNGSKVTQPQDPSLEGYKFLGWYTNPDGVDKFNFNAPVLTDLFLYARWGNPDGSEGLYSTSTGGGTDFSITDIQKSGADFDVTINVNYAAILVLDILDENTKAVIASGASYTPNYCEMTPIKVSVEGQIPAHFIARARIIDGDEHDLCNPFESIHFTTKYAEYEAKTVNDFDEDDVVVNFDDSPNENFGVLADGVKVLDTSNGKNQVTLKYQQGVDEEGDPATLLAGYQITNPDETVKALKPGDIIMALTADGNAIMFKIASMRQQNGSYFFTEAGNNDLTDFYSYLKVDMPILGDDSSTQTPPSAENNSQGEDSLVGLDIINIDGAKASAKISLLETTIGVVKLKDEGSISAEVSAHYDAKLFAKNYFEFSLKITKENTATISGDVTNKIKREGKKDLNTIKEIKLIDDKPIPTKIPGVTITPKVKLKVDITLTAGIDLVFKSTDTSGFTYDTNSGRHKIDKKNRDVDVKATGEAEFKVGLKASIGPSLGKDILAASVYGETGIKADLTCDMRMVQATTGESVHACDVCASGVVNWYIDVGGDVTYCVAKNICEGTILDGQLFSFEKPVPFLLNPSGKIFVSIKNSPDSIYHGQLHFGFGECQNKQYRVTVKAKDGNNNAVAENITIKKENGDTITTKRTDFTVYLYDGKYTFSGKINSKDVSKTVVVSGAPKTVTLTPNSGDGEISGKIVSADSQSPVSDATILLSSGDVDVATIKSDANGEYNKKVPSGTYKMTISKEGYTTVESYVSISDGTQKYVETTLMVAASSWNTSRGGFSGTIRDAVSGNPIQGVSLDLRKGWNAPESENIIKTLTTDANGTFKYDIKRIAGLIWGLNPGNYTLTAKKEGYATISFNIIVVSGKVTGNQDVTMSTEVAEGVYRVVLTWGSTPDDLDSHYIGETKDQVTEHIYFANQTGSSANLDRDDTSSFGPETVTITSDKLAHGFFYAVHDFTNRENDQDTALSASSASVTVYNGNNKVQTYNVPTGKIGNVWNVFSVDANGQFTAINTFDSIEDPGSVGQAA